MAKKMMYLAFKASLFTLQSDFFAYSKLLQHGATGFTSPPKEGILRIFITLKNPLLRLGLNL
jgi:hypothetical protein